MFAMQLMGSERERLKLFSFDEGWRLLGDPVGRTLLASLQRMGRSELAVPIIWTQLVTDALVGERESLENLIGATFVFGMRSDAEARRALAAAGPRPRRPRDAPEPARVRRRPLPVARPPRPRRGDPGRPRAAVAAAGVLDHPRQRVSAARRAGGALARVCSRDARRRDRWLRTGARRARGSGVRHRYTVPSLHARREAPTAAGHSPSTAPGGPPLAEGSDGGTSAGEDIGASTAPPGESDPLVGNGLGSPLCKGVLRAELSGRQQTATAKRLASSRRPRRPATTAWTFTSTQACRD